MNKDEITTMYRLSTYPSDILSLKQLKVTKKTEKTVRYIPEFAGTKDITLVEQIETSRHKWFDTPQEALIFEKNRLYKILSQSIEFQKDLSKALDTIFEQMQKLSK